MLNTGKKLQLNFLFRRATPLMLGVVCATGATMAGAQVPPPGGTPAPFPTAKPVPTRRPVQPLTPGVVVKQSKAPTPARATTTSRSALPLQITLEGIVTKTARNGEFFLSANESVYRVRPWSMNFASKVEGGDRVRVFGRGEGLMVTLANIRVLEKRASSSPDVY